MKFFQRYNVRRILFSLLWIGVGSIAVVLLAAGVHARDKKHCKGLEITIEGVRNHFFIDKTDIRNIITSYVNDEITGIETSAFDLVGMEKDMKKEVWVKDANLFFDNNQVLQVHVTEREPIARIFTLGGSSYYIDETRMMLPLSPKITARLPVFTNFPSETKVLSKRDSLLLNNVKMIAEQIQKDSFLIAMIDQVDITPSRTFEMVPKIGEQVIVFGDASDAEEKFKKLQLFYRKVMTKYGWSRYSVINLQYKGQVVGKLKGKDDYSADSLRTVEIMHAIAMNAARAAGDSLQTILQDNERNTTDISIIQQSMERDDEGEDGPAFPVYPGVTESEREEVKVPVKVEAKPVAKPAVASHKPANTPKKPTPKKATPKAKAVVKKPVAKPTVKPPGANGATKPKILMPKQNDY